MFPKPKKNWHFYINYTFTFFSFRKTKLGWKDKFNTPRCERVPSYQIEFLWWGFYIEFGDDQYWEQRIWWHFYCDEDYEKAKKEWPWREWTTYEGFEKKSTWIDY
jgi:hypothetical protein